MLPTSDEQPCRAQPSSSERLAEALTALMSAPRSPLFSSSAMPLMVVPAGEATLSFSTPGCVMLPSGDASKICKRAGTQRPCIVTGMFMYDARL